MSTVSAGRDQAARLTEYLDGVLPGSGELTVAALSGGLSNELLVISRAAQPGQRWVLRKPPAGTGGDGAHDVLREAKILSALDDTDVPHGHVLTACADTTVLGVPFFVMPYYDGLLLRRELPADFDEDAGRTVMWHSLIDTLASVQAVEPSAVGLETRHPGADYNARQLDRWLNVLAGYKHRRIPQLEEVGRRLSADPPAPQKISLIHGDYGLHNVLFERDEPRVQVILDWETAKGGDPLVDLAHFLSAWLRGDDHRRWFGARPELDLSGFPPASVLAGRYAAAAGVSIDRLDWYLAFARLRIAVILEGSYTRFIRGGNRRADHATLGDRVINIADQALAITRGEA